MPQSDQNKGEEKEPIHTSWSLNLQIYRTCFNSLEYPTIVTLRLVQERVKSSRTWVKVQVHTRTQKMKMLIL